MPFNLARIKKRWPPVDGRIILKLIFKNWERGMGSGEGQVMDSCECGNELTGFIKGGEILD